MFYRRSHSIRSTVYTTTIQKFIVKGGRIIKVALKSLKFAYVVVKLERIKEICTFSCVSNLLWVLMSSEVSTFGHQIAFIKVPRVLNWFKSAKNQICTG